MDTAPDAALRDQLRDALTREHYRRATERIEASPEEHCAAFADVVMQVLAEPRGDLRDQLGEAMRAHYIGDQTTAMGEHLCVCGEWADGTDADDWDDHLADAVMPVVAAALTAARDETARERQRAEKAEGAIQRAHRSLTIAENRAVIDGDARATIAIRNARAALDRPADLPAKEPR